MSAKYTFQKCKKIIKCLKCSGSGFKGVNQSSWGVTCRAHARWSWWKKKSWECLYGCDGGWVGQRARESVWYAYTVAESVEFHQWHKAAHLLTTCRINGSLCSGVNMSLEWIYCCTKLSVIIKLLVDTRIQYLSKYNTIQFDIITFCAFIVNKREWLWWMWTQCSGCGK